MEEIITLIKETYGIVGLLIAAPFISCIYLWRDNVRLNNVRAKELKDAMVMVSKAQEQRVEDATKIRDKLFELASEQMAASKETNMALERVSDLLSSNNQVHSFPDREDR